MTIEQNIFKRADINFDKLKDFGFKQFDGKWLYEKIFFNGLFKAIIKIDDEGNVCGDVLETDSNDIYFPLRVESMTDGFVGKVRTEYKKILEEVKKHCCKIKYFVYPQTNRLTQKIYEKYGDLPEFPWEKFNDCGVFKNPDTKKWYALIMTIDFSKINKNFSEKVEVVNIKLDADKISDLLRKNGFYPAYHMNKKYWISIVLNDTVADDVLFSLIEESYAFSLRKH